MTIKTVKELIERLKDLPPNATVGVEGTSGDCFINDVDWGCSKTSDVAIVLESGYDVVDTSYDDREDADYWECKYWRLKNSIEEALD